MGLTNTSTGINLLYDYTEFKENNPDELIIALAGNPNVGKSSVFNSLTGLKQHTGNWPGKTVTHAYGKYRYNGKTFILIDLPGTYSLMANSPEEEIARDFICFSNPDVTVVVADATSLEKSLNLILQTLELTKKVVVCINLIDEAEKKNIKIDMEKLSIELGVPVVATNARKKVGLKKLIKAVYDVATLKKTTQKAVFKVKYDTKLEHALNLLEPFIPESVSRSFDTRWVCLKLLEGDKNFLDNIQLHIKKHCDEYMPLEYLVEKSKNTLSEIGYNEDTCRSKIVSNIIHKAENIYNKTVSYENKEYNEKLLKIDRILTSKIFGIPIMITLLGLIFWITVVGANFPSEIISKFLMKFQGALTSIFKEMNAPKWLYEILVLGMYRTLAWVVSVMLPPMAIFFPLFSFLEDLGYLPRVAFNLDKFFKKACAHGKQSLTMCMGFGCNAAGVIGCRIINSPREKLIAIITNNFVPCNGRFPTLIAISSIFLGSIAPEHFRTFISTLSLTMVVLLGIVMTLAVSKLLSKTLLKGIPSSFTLELPPFRKPQLGRTILRSVFDRTLFVLGRAVSIAVPAGLIIWLMANVNINGASILTHCAQFLDPFAHLLGLDGYILMAFILALPANEIVIPIIIMSYMSTNTLLELGSLAELRNLLLANGWTPLTGICVMLFSLMHYPCGTTLWTIYKETQSNKWAIVSFLLPTICGIIVCFTVATFARILGLT